MSTPLSASRWAPANPSRSPYDGAPTAGSNPSSVGSSPSPHQQHNNSWQTSQVHQQYDYNQAGDRNTASHNVGYEWSQSPSPQTSHTAAFLPTAAFPDSSSLSPSSSDLSSSRMQQQQESSLSRRGVSSSTTPSISQHQSGSLAPRKVLLRAELSDAAPLTAVQIVQRVATKGFFVRLVGVSLCMLLLSAVYIWLSTPSPLLSVPTPNEEVFCPSAPYAHVDVSHLLHSWQAQCINCPAYGTCENGKLTCPEGYYKVYHQCVAISDHVTKGIELKERVISALESHAGARICGDTTTPGAPLSDLTAPELMEYVRPFHPTQAETFQFDRAWSYVQMWLHAEGVLLQEYNPKNPYKRLVTVNVDPLQPIRFRAVYPKLSWSCRVQRTLSSSKLSVVFFAILFTLVVYAALVLKFIFLYVLRSNLIANMIRDKVREDYDYDYDRKLLVHQAHSVNQLREEYAYAAARGSTVKGKGSVHPSDEAPLDEQELVMQRLVWARVQQLLRDDPHLEKGTWNFQMEGLAPSWRYIGPTPDSAESKMAGRNSSSDADAHDPHAHLHKQQPSRSRTAGYDSGFGKDL